MYTARHELRNDAQEVVAIFAAEALNPFWLNDVGMRAVVWAKRGKVGNLLPQRLLQHG